MHELQFTVAVAVEVTDDPERYPTTSEEIDIAAEVRAALEGAELTEVLSSAVTGAWEVVDWTVS